MRRNRQTSDAESHLTSTIPPPGWALSNGTSANSTTIRSFGEHLSSDRRCPVCLQTFSSDPSHHVSRHHHQCQSGEIDSQRNNSTASSRSSRSSMLLSTDRHEAIHHTSSKFIEEISRAGTFNDHPTSSRDVFAYDEMLLRASDDSATRSRRRSAISCGSDGEQRISIGAAYPKRIARHGECPYPVAHGDDEQYYHLNGVRMIF